MQLDSMDLRILDSLQRDGRASVETVAEQVGLSATPTRRRIRLLEQAGVIEGYTARINPERCGLAMTVYVFIKLERRDRKTIESFERAVARLDEIVRCDLVSGSADYLMTLYVRDIEHYNRYLRTTLADIKGIDTIETSVSISKVTVSDRLVPGL